MAYSPINDILETFRFFLAIIVLLLFFGTLGVIFSGEVMITKIIDSAIGTILLLLGLVVAIPSLGFIFWIFSKLKDSQPAGYY